MKKILLLSLISILFSGCISGSSKTELTEKDQRIVELEQQIEQLKNEKVVIGNIETDEVLSENIEKTKPEVNLSEEVKKLQDEAYIGYYEIIEELKIRFPEDEIILTEVKKKQLFPEMLIWKSFPCHGVESATFFKKNWFDDTLEIESDLGLSNDKISIKINSDDTITFLTAAAVENGYTEGEKSTIIANNDVTLIAQDIDGYNVVSTITISKETGLGIRQKTSASGLPMSYKVPYGIMVYLQCYLE